MEGAPTADRNLWFRKVLSRREMPRGEMKLCANLLTRHAILQGEIGKTTAENE